MLTRPQDTRRALDQILSAMPALQQLRHSLDTTSNPRETMTELENIWQMRDLPPNLVATRPAATLAEQLVLDTLEEDSEAASQLDQADIGLAQDGGVKIKQCVLPPPRQADATQTQTNRCRLQSYKVPPKSILLSPSGPARTQGAISICRSPPSGRRDSRIIPSLSVSTQTGQETQRKRFIGVLK